ncbi:hypothetical protein [Chryseobacterium terrae]|uniref:Uncharacterized protein n=1 Tax=Chryseobacterium terrae TaxID=3163299 RepID=A0ABW8Y278_9FLAO
MKSQFASFVNFFIIHHSSLITHHSSFIIHHSSFIIHHPSSIRIIIQRYELYNFNYTKSQPNFAE